MSTLLLNMNAPLQSWGVSSKFSDRRTLRHPTKSAVIGMIACALGWDRTHDLSELTNNLRFGVRVLSEGNLERDYQIEAYHLERDGRKPDWRFPSKVSTRWYISDAKSVIGLESDNKSLLQKISHVLKNPKFSIYCGRKAFPAPWNLVGNITEDNLEKALESIPSALYDVIESNDGNVIYTDTPVSFDSTNRQYKETTYMVKRYEKQYLDYMSYFDSKDD